MTTWQYPAVIQELADDEWLVTFPDIPEAITSGGTLEEATFNAEDALETVILTYLAHSMPIPAPCAARGGETLINLDPITAARAALARVMAAQHVSNVALAKRMNKTEGAIRRLVDGSSSVKMDTVLQALNALGARAVLETA